MVEVHYNTQGSSCDDWWVRRFVSHAAAEAFVAEEKATDAQSVAHFARPECEESCPAVIDARRERGHLTPKLRLALITQREANAFIRRHHRHHNPAQGDVFRIAATDAQGQVCGVIVIGRPVARHLDDGDTLEVTRCCTDGTPNAPSMLYAAAWRAARAMGAQRLITYTLASEPGTSLKAAGWQLVGQTKGGSWSRPSRQRTDKHPTGQKTLWEAA